MLSDVRKRLSQVEKLKPGSGVLDFGFRADKHQFGVGLSYDHRITSNFSAFAEGQAMYDYQTRDWNGQALGGLRWRF